MIVDILVATPILPPYHIDKDQFQYRLWLQEKELRISFLIYVIKSSDKTYMFSNNILSLFSRKSIQSDII